MNPWNAVAPFEPIARYTTLTNDGAFTAVAAMQREMGDSGQQQQQRDAEDAADEGDHEVVAGEALGDDQQRRRRHLRRRIVKFTLIGAGLVVVVLVAFALSALNGRDRIETGRNCCRIFG